MREAAGVHIAALAVTLKVPVSKLEALEADRHDVFSDAVFMRALASSVCRTLKVDAAPVLALLPQSEPTRLKADKGINASFKDEGVRLGRGGMEAPKPRLMSIAVVLLLAAAVAIALLPRGADDAPTASAAPQQAQAEPAVAEAQPLALAASAAVQPMEPLAAPQVGAPAAEPQVAASEPAAAPAAAASAAAPQTDGALVIRARESSWIQIRSASGAVLAQKTLEAGESIAATGTPPWSVVIGRADATDVIVRGKPMDLSTVARENVARFEVK
jgi:cytoskeleton protein RodZ